MSKIDSLELNKYNPTKFSIPQLLLILFAGLVSIFILNISIGQTGTPIIYIVLGVSILFLTLLVYNPKLWIHSVILVSGVFSSTTGGGVSAIDVVFSIYLNIFLYLWIIWQVMVKKEKLIQSKTEWFFLAFFILTTLTLINVFHDKTVFFEWIREFSLLSLMLLYFPMKKYFTNHRDVVILLIIFTITLLFSDLLQFYIYKQILSNITYAYEAGSTIRNNTYMYVIGTTFSCIFIFYQKETKYRVLLTIIMILTLGALTSTFARIFWAAAFVNIITIFLLLNVKEKVRFLSYFVISVVLAYLIASIFFGDIFKFVIFALESRFESTSQGTEDISAISRFEEWKVVIEKIKESPFIGNGFGAVFTFRNPITGKMGYSSVIHNSFLHFFFRIGIPLTLTFFGLFGVIFIKSIFYSIKLKIDTFYRLLMIGVFLSIISLIITGMFTMTFIFRDTLIINAILFFLVNYVEVNYKNKVLN
ncbi:MAG: O-antigen ligase family protein [Candidatus Kapaibacterium sp.]